MDLRFDNFRVDLRSNSLYFNDELVDGLNKKSVQILLVLLHKPKQVVSHEEIISRVWGDNYSGITSQNIAQYIRRLRKIFSQLRPDESFIGTAPNRGYIFEKDVVQAEANVPQNPEQVESEPGQAGSIPDDDDPQSTPGNFKKWLVTIVSLLAVAVIALVILVSKPSLFGSPEETVRKVVQESQLYESLVLYRDPKSFKESDLDKYWSSEIDTNSNVDRKRIREGVRSLLEKGLYYGAETKCEQFEFQSVEIDAKNNLALVKTLEKWFIAVYREDGTLEKNKYVGPYFVSYVVRNIDGRWLIEKSNTARANLPTPTVSSIEPLTEPAAGHQFFIKITGQGFLPQSVYIRVTGEGCPEQNPCIVPNGALLKHSRLSEDVLDNVPLTLAAGDFQIYVHNSENHTSNPVVLSIPDR